MNLPIVGDHDVRMHPFAHFPPLPPEEKHPAIPEYGNGDDRKNSEKEQTDQQDHAHHHREQADRLEETEMSASLRLKDALEAYCYYSAR